MMKHELKVHPQFWEQLKSNAKPFDVRVNDRKFHVGDKCVLRFYDPTFGYNALAPIERTITFVMAYEDFPNGIQRGYVVLGFGIDTLDDGR